MRLLLKILAFIAIILSALWSISDFNYGAILTLLFALLAFIGLFINQDKVEKEKLQNINIFNEVYQRILREYPNFEKMAKGINQHFNSESHRLAATVYPYELMSDAIKKLSDIHRFSSISKKLINALKDKDNKEILRLLDKLKGKLNKYIT